jgi:hypothetical protein
VDFTGVDVRRRSEKNPKTRWEVDRRSEEPNSDVVDLEP